MRSVLIAVELVSTLVENFASLYFLNSRFESKHKWYWPQFGTWSVLVLFSLVIANSNSTYDFATYGILLAYLVIFKFGIIVQKVFGVLIVFSIEMGTSIVGAGLASVIGSTTIEHTLEYQDTSRLLALVFIKMMQVVVFYILAKKHEKARNLQKRPAFVLGGVAIIDFVFLIMIRMYVESPDLSPRQNPILVWLSIGALLVMIAIFMIYELFIHEEIKNVELATNLQHIELELGFLKELDNIYTDMRNWQHDYKNNLNALRALVDNIETEKALNFIDNMCSETYKNQITMQTGNLALDAIVSSKLWLAQSQKIEVSIQAVYSDIKYINDNDLCAIVGNLIDNAIEACVRMGETTEKKFIDFSIMIKKKNLLLSINNSYNNELKRKGNRYFTMKREPFHGIGIRHVDSIVDKYHGHVLRSQENGVFETHIMLPLLSPDEVDVE